MRTVHTFQPNPAADITAYIAEDGEFSARCVETGAYDRMVADYEQQIDRALPGGMWIDWAESPTRIVTDCHLFSEDFSLMVDDVLLGIDIGKIIERHDPGKIESRTEMLMAEGPCNCCGQALIRTRTEVYCSDPVCGYIQPL